MKVNKTRRKRTGVFLCSMLLFLFLTASFSAYGEEDEAAEEESVRYVELMDYVETIYDESNGMDTSEANALMQDAKGYVWIGSYSGFCRYNGQEFENMSRTRENAPQSGIRVLFSGIGNILWIGTNDSGLYYFTNEEFLFIENSENLSVRAIAQGSDGTLYAGTTDGLFKVTGSRAAGFSMEPIFEEELGDVLVENLMIDNQRRLWGTTASNQLFAIQNGRLQVFLEKGQVEYPLGGGMIQTTDGSIYAGMDAGGILKIQVTENIYNSCQLTITEIPIGSKESVNDIYQDSQGKIWVCTDYGAGYFQGDNIFHEVEGFFDNTILAKMMEDYEGNLWFASTRRGIFKMTKSRFKNISYKAGVDGQTINAVVLHNRALYIGMDTGLVIMDEYGEKVENELTRLLSGIRIRNLMSDSQGNLWISTYKEYGLICYDSQSGSWISMTKKDGMPNDQIRMTCELENGMIGAATNGGIVLIQDKEVIKTYTAADGIQNETILCLAPVTKDILLAGSDGNGIYQIQLNTGEVKNITVDDGLQSGVILRMVPDKKAEGIWISNGSELALLRQDGITQLPRVSAGSGSVFDIKVEEDSLWLFKSFGIIQISREDLINGTENYTVYARKDGLNGSITANSWNYCGKEGMMFLCTGNGVYFIDNTQIYKNTAQPRIAVGSVQTDDQVYYGAQEILLPSVNQRITIYANLLTFGFSDGKLEYYLEGFDKEPVILSGKAEYQISYTNLAGGDYVFHMKGYNADGMESSELTFKIRKELSVFEQQFFYVGIVIGIAFLFLITIVILQFMNKKRILKQQQEYKNMTNQIIRITAKTIDAKDKYTIGHSNRVALYSLEIGRRYGLSEEELEQLYHTGLLHDIGKIGIPDHILNKAGRLTAEEFEVIKTHPTIGGEILKDFAFAPWISSGAKYHHERYDGKGYNEGLQGMEIPLFARIISVADAYDGMNSNRVYRKGLTREIILNELKKGMGTQFDETFASIMVDMIEEGFMVEDENSDRQKESADGQNNN